MSTTRPDRLDRSTRTGRAAPRDTNTTSARPSRRSGKSVTGATRTAPRTPWTPTTSPMIMRSSEPRGRCAPATRFLRCPAGAATGRYPPLGVMRSEAEASRISRMIPSLTRISVREILSKRLSPTETLTVPSIVP